MTSEGPVTGDPTLSLKQLRKLCLESTANCHPPPNHPHPKTPKCPPLLNAPAPSPPKPSLPASKQLPPLSQPPPRNHPPLRTQAVISNAKTKVSSLIPEIVRNTSGVWTVVHPTWELWPISLPALLVCTSTRVPILAISLATSSARSNLQQLLLLPRLRSH
uniref:Uncharacterized protein n=1 Tax=Cacopsylla melanoneura TaxID=428564 RepID=A0A8D8M450_9HEMI